MIYCFKINWKRQRGLHLADAYKDCVHAQWHSHVQLFVTQWTLAHQFPLFMEFPRQERWSGLPPSLHGIFPIQGSNPYFLHLLHCRCFFTAEPPWKDTKLRGVLIFFKKYFKQTYACTTYQYNVGLTAISHPCTQFLLYLELNNFLYIELIFFLHPDISL